MKNELKILSSVCTNLIVFWVVGIFSSQSIIVLTENLIAAILTWRLAVWFENLTNSYDKS